MMNNNLRVGDKVKVRIYGIDGKAIKTNNFDEVFEVVKEDGKLGIYWTEDFAPFESFCNTEFVKQLPEEMKVSDIEKLQYDDIKDFAVEEMQIKDHDILFVEIPGAFGYSALVFKDNRQVYHANQYQLHFGYLFKESGVDGLRSRYIEILNNKLYTDAELLEECRTYDEYEKKTYFVRNYYIMRYDYRTAWAFGREQNEELEKEKKNYKFFNPVSFCYVNDESIAEKQKEFLNHLEKEYSRLKNNIEIFREMVSKELANHEACITCDYTDALRALGLSFESLTDAQKKVVKEELRKQIESYSL